MSEVEAYVALGANLGPRRATLRWALRMLDGAPGVRVLATSRLVETEAVGGPPGSPRFLNGVARLVTTRSPHDLLALLLELEARTGRVRTRQLANAPRTLDLDLLLHGDARVEDERLVLPHPRMGERLFVLEPLSELAPDLVLPREGVTVCERLARLRAPAVEVAP